MDKAAYYSGFFHKNIAKSPSDIKPILNQMSIKVNSIWAVFCGGKNERCFKISACYLPDAYYNSTVFLFLHR